MYQRVEVAPAAEAACAGPRLQWDGKSREETVSLSHTDQEACACVCAGGAVGVDVETVAPRAAAFYRCNYSETEQQWVDQGARVDPRSHEWLFTLLWTIKEAALKARVVCQKSPWSFTGVGLEELPDPRDVLWAHLARTWGEEGGVFTGSIEQQCGAVPVEVAYWGTRDLTLSVVRACGSWGSRSP
jgi:phosphopantetheinyl transferase (holo-ACP synthase)